MVTMGQRGRDHDARSVQVLSETNTKLRTLDSHRDDSPDPHLTHTAGRPAGRRDETRR